MKFPHSKNHLGKALNGEAGVKNLTKKGVCFFWKNGSCIRGTDCRFRHSFDEELRKGDKDQTDPPEEAVEEEALRLWNWCKAKVLEFKDKPEAIPFLEPVDWVKLKLPLYPNIIKKPMDLSTVRGKLVRHEYSDIVEFNKDMELIWSNAKKFNRPSSDIF